MIINVQIDVPEATMLMALKMRGYVVVSHDFGYWRTEYHNRPVWHEDLRPAVIVEQQPMSISDAFTTVFRRDIMTSTLRSINQLTY